MLSLRLNILTLKSQKLNGGISHGMKVSWEHRYLRRYLEIETNWFFADLFAKDADAPSLVNVAAKAYRRVALYEPGEYVATLTYYDGSTTTANWLVRDLATERRTKNILLFIGDGMTTNMITAARLIGHKTKNGKYQSKMVSLTSCFLSYNCR